MAQWSNSYMWQLPAARIPLNRLLYRAAIPAFSPLAVRKGIHWHCKFNSITGRSNRRLQTSVSFWAVVVDMASGRYCWPPELKGWIVAKPVTTLFPAASKLWRQKLLPGWHSHSKSGWNNGGICVENIQLINGRWDQGTIKHCHELLA